MEKAIFAAGCFWCVEAIFKELKGVDKVKSGYINGNRPNPTYEQVCTGVTHHAEAVEITYDPNVISYDTLLNVFFSIHDPTQLNRQGGDVGTQYRSAIFYLNEAQKQAANEKLSELAPHFQEKIVTAVEKAETFYDAEDYHDNYFAENPESQYCQFVVAPKYLKAKTKFKELWKD